MSNGRRFDSLSDIKVGMMVEVSEDTHYGLRDREGWSHTRDQVVGHTFKVVGNDGGIQLYGLKINGRLYNFNWYYVLKTGTKIKVQVPSDTDEPMFEDKYEDS